MPGKEELRVAVEWLTAHGYRVIAEDNRLKQVCEAGGASRLTAESFRGLLRPVSAGKLVEEYEEEQAAMLRSLAE